ncbi:hypothetical protein ACWDBF_10740 [Streptomyces angustmyceticus]|uniref:Secreted protein n=1 Tax=Streptomyces angustmyceticus TaxID=285578 RepID=A0A5J4LEA9_9ACTN|nr:hypothetical protein [Streptomyces angustmyceticus]UAL71060.1 hypothetical protein K7396_34700 [Streptomyces angustmyceticus]GES32493.1 hypothetical protein San01_49800 [Streptomyces angustmyceticus]
MRNRRIFTTALAAAALTVIGLGGAAQAHATTGAAAAPAAAHVQAKPMDGPPGTVWTGKKFWTLGGCQAAGTDLVSSGKWADPFCDGGGLQWDLWARPL